MMEFSDTGDGTPYKIKNSKQKKSETDYLTGWESLGSHHIKRVRKESLKEGSKRMIKSAKFQNTFRLKRPQTGNNRKRKAARVASEATGRKRRPNSAISRYMENGYLIDHEEISSYFESNRIDEASKAMFEDSFSELKRKNPLAKLKKLKSSKRKKRIFNLTQQSGDNFNGLKSIGKKIKKKGGFLLMKKGTKRKRDKIRNGIKSLDFGMGSGQEKSLMVKNHLRFVNDTFDKISKMAKIKDKPQFHLNGFDFEQMKSPFKKIEKKSKIGNVRKSSFDQRKQRIENNRLNNYLVSKKLSKKLQKKSRNFFSKDSFENMVRVIQRKKKEYPSKRFDFRSPKFIMSKNIQMKFKQRGSSDVKHTPLVPEDTPLSFVRKSQPFRKQASVDHRGTKLMRKSMKEMLRKSVKSFKIDMRAIFENKFEKI